MTLIQIQRDFIEFLRRPADRYDSGRVPAGPEQARMYEPVHPHVAAGGIGVERRLHIYHHAYRARLLEVMHDVFERTWSYLGDSGFDALARAFIEAAPAGDRTLNRFGAGFPAWLAARFAGDETHAEIAEVAMMDWLMRCAFDGADASPLALPALAAIDSARWATVGFSFHPTTALAPLVHNAASIWEALEQDLAPPPMKRLAAPLTLLVWRKDLRPHYMTIDPVEADAIGQLMRGTSFADTCAALAARYPDHDTVTMVGAALRRWIDEEMLVDIVDAAAQTTLSQT